MKTMEEAEREAHGYWFDRAEKAERELMEALHEDAKLQQATEIQLETAERERDEARATLERVRLGVNMASDALEAALDEALDG